MSLFGDILDLNEIRERLKRVEERLEDIIMSDFPYTIYMDF